MNATSNLTYVGVMLLAGVAIPVMAAMSGGIGVRVGNPSFATATVFGLAFLLICRRGGGDRACRASASSPPSRRGSISAAPASRSTAFRSPSSARASDSPMRSSACWSARSSRRRRSTISAGSARRRPADRRQAPARHGGDGRRAVPREEIGGAKAVFLHASDLPRSSPIRTETAVSPPSTFESRAASAAFVRLESRLWKRDAACSRLCFINLQSAQSRLVAVGANPCSRRGSSNCAGSAAPAPRRNRDRAAGC